MRCYFPMVLSMILILTACGGDHGSHHAHHDGQIDADDGQIDADKIEIVLDGGAKWKMDDHTRSMFQVMTERVEANGDAKEVGAELQADLDTLIQGCTMTGEAHNQLHVFLTSYIPAVQEMSESGSVESLNRVRTLLRQYQKYFE